MSSGGAGKDDHRNTEALAIAKNRVDRMGEAKGTVHWGEKSQLASWDGIRMGWEDLDMGIWGHFI